MCVCDTLLLRRLSEAGLQVIFEIVSPAEWAVDDGVLPVVLVNALLVKAVTAG